VNWIKMAESTSAAKLEEKKTYFGLSVAELLAAIITLGGLALNFLGKVSHEIYLKSLGIDADLFPKAIDWNVIHGYYVLCDRMLYASSTLLGDKKTFILVMAGIISLTLYIYLLSFVTKPRAPESVRKKLAWIPAWPKKLVLVLLIACTATIAIPAVLAAALILLAIPAAIGRSEGIAQAKKDLQIFSQGCEKAPIENRCIELQKDGKPFEPNIQGFSIDSSESHVALYDINLKKVRVIELSGIGIMTDPPAQVSRQTKP
jgi:hypothetical protein